MTLQALDHWTCHYLSPTMGGMDADPWTTLANHVTKRRSQLGLTQGQVRVAGGPGPSTMRSIERVLQTSYKPHVLRSLERALQWEPGSVDAILNGGDPTPIAPPTTHPASPRTATAYLQELADNPNRTDALRNWARAQLMQLHEIQVLDEAEAIAKGERQAG